MTYDAECKRILYRSCQERDGRISQSPTLNTINYIKMRRAYIIIIIITTHECGVVMFSVASVCLSVMLRFLAQNRRQSR